MRVRITTDVRQDELILEVNEVWFNVDEIWKMIRHTYDNHKTHRIIIESGFKNV